VVLDVCFLMFVRSSCLFLDVCSIVALFVVVVLLLYQVQLALYAWSRKTNIGQVAQGPVGDVVAQFVDLGMAHRVADVVDRSGSFAR